MNIEQGISNNEGVFPSPQYSLFSRPTIRARRGKREFKVTFAEWKSVILVLDSPEYRAIRIFSTILRHSLFDIRYSLFSFSSPSIFDIPCSIFDILFNLSSNLPPAPPPLETAPLYPVSF
jgi:hypothetical protein